MDDVSEVHRRILELMGQAMQHSWIHVIRDGKPCALYPDGRIVEIKTKR